MLPPDRRIQENYTKIWDANGRNLFWGAGGKPLLLGTEIGMYRFAAAFLDYSGAGGGNRTRTPLARPRILSPVRLPVPPPRHVVQCVERGDSTGLA